MITEVVSLYSKNEQSVSGMANATDTSDNVIIAGQGTGRYLYITTLIVDNTSANDTHVDIKDGSTTRLRIPAPKNSGAVVTLPKPLRLTENSPLKFAAVTGVTTLTVSAVGYWA